MHDTITNLDDWFTLPDSEEVRRDSAGDVDCDSPDDKAVKLVLPLPPSPNRSGGKNVFTRQSSKNSYRLDCWYAAVNQVVPFVDPPQSVQVSSVFYLRNRRDEDNLKASLKHVLDALKLVQTGSVDWKGNDSRAYFVDDDPGRCTVLEPTQHIDRKKPRLELTLTWADCSLEAKK